MREIRRKYDVDSPTYELVRDSLVITLWLSLWSRIGNVNVPLRGDTISSELMEVEW